MFCLLFLYRLERIALVDGVGGTTRTLARQQGPAADVTSLLDESVRDGGLSAVSRQDWLVVRETLAVEDRRPGVDETEVALAFPLREASDDASDSHAPLQPLAVFAYLPLRS